MKKILLFGSTGFVGSMLKEELGKKGCHVDFPRIEVRDLTQVERAIEQSRPDRVINATGITGKPNVDWCESHPAQTLGVNVAGSIHIASAAQRKGIHVTQISSGCMYDGDNGGKGFSEEDEPNFFGSLYSRSRVLSEKALKEFPNVLQLRIRIPILGKPHPKNLIDKLLRYPEMINQNNSCTVMEDFVPAAIKLMERGETGIFNMTNIGHLNHVQMMELYKEIADPNFEIRVMSPAKEEELNKRRSNCVLNVEKRERLGVRMPELEESVRLRFEEYKRSKY